MQKQATGLGQQAGESAAAKNGKQQAAAVALAQGAQGLQQGSQQLTSGAASAHQHAQGAQAGAKQMAAQNPGISDALDAQQK